MRRAPCLVSKLMRPCSCFAARGYRASASAKRRSCTEQMLKSGNISAVSGLRPIISGKIRRGHVRSASSAASGNSILRRPFATRAKAAFPALCPMQKELRYLCGHVGCRPPAERGGTEAHPAFTPTRGQNSAISHSVQAGLRASHTSRPNHTRR